MPLHVMKKYELEVLTFEAKICKSVQNLQGRPGNGACRFGVNCSFAHSEEEKTRWDIEGRQLWKYGGVQWTILDNEVTSNESARIFLAESIMKDCSLEQL